MKKKLIIAFNISCEQTQRMFYCASSTNRKIVEKQELKFHQLLKKEQLEKQLQDVYCVDRRKQWVLIALASMDRFK